MGRFIIIILLILTFFIILSVLLKKVIKEGEYITLNEVIPGARIISESEGIIEYNDKRFILGQNDFKRKRELIRLLHPDTIINASVIDFRFRRQIIVRKNVF